MEKDKVYVFEGKTTNIEEFFKDLKEKYKQRFLKGDDKKDAEDKKEEVDEELEEKDVIDIKEI